MAKIVASHNRWKDMLGRLSGLGNTFFAGYLVSQGPHLFKGFLGEYLKDTKPADVVKVVNEGNSLWSMVGIEHEESVLNVMRRLGPMEWLTADWIIAALGEKNPSLASLFMSWDEGRAWLECQVTDLKARVLE